MSLRLIGFIGLYGFSILFAFILPQAGVWGFVFESNYHPPHHWWGKSLMAFADRWSFYIGAVMILATALHWARFSKAKVFSHPSTILLGLFTLNAFVVSLWAYAPDVSWKETFAIFKWFLFYICVVRTHSNRKWLPVLLMIYTLTCFDIGWEATFHHKGGRRVPHGPTTLGDENMVAAHMVALLPLVIVYMMSPNTKLWYRIACFVGAPLMLNVVAHAQSRGAFLALVGAGICLLFVSKGRLKTYIIIGILVGSLVSVRLFHEQFLERISTIFNSQNDGSVEGRILAWKDAWQLSMKNPFGYGGEAFDNGLRSGTKTTHNIFFECLVAWGWQGVFLFFGFIFMTLYECRKIQNNEFLKGTWPQSREYLDATAIISGIIGMLIAGIFINRMRWELWWVLGAYVICLKNTTRIYVLRK